MIEQKRLKELLEYDLETGVFKWKVTRCQNAVAGQLAGCRGNHGYFSICLDRRSYLAHRLAWLYVYGVWPREQLDHVNHDRADNRFINLREATQIQNTQNAICRRDNFLKRKGIRKTPSGRYEARLTYQGKYLHLGTFSDIGAAAQVISEKRRALQGAFAYD